jgi:hypothetical protein
MPNISNLNLPVISFDTSVFNRMLDDGSASEPIFAALKHGYHFRLIGPNVEEMIATTEPERREKLFQVCRRLVYQGDSDTIYPHQELLRRLILAHTQDATNFVWQNVNMLSLDYENGIGDWELIRDKDLSAEQRESARTANAAFEPIWADLRPKLAEVFLRGGENPPRTFSEAARRIGSEGGLVWSVGKMLYDHIAGKEVQEKQIREFMGICPPFRAIIYAFLMMWYDGAVRDSEGEKFKAGRTDLLMAAHLPYCAQFVTAEKKREQEKCLREIVSFTSLSTLVRSYDDFCNSFLVGV